MTDSKIKLRARLLDGVLELQLLITHPMETGMRTDKNTQKKIPAHFIQKVNVELNGKVVVVVNTGSGVSEDPLLGFRVKGAKSGDKLKISWVDNQGGSGAHEAVVDG